jgi:arylsulfatase A-like enzyme
LSQPNIILVTLDTMRADRLGAERHGRPLTPNMSQLAGEGRVFTGAVAAGVPTYFGFPPLFRGGGALDGGKVIGIAPGRTTFVEELSRLGYGTAAVVASNPYLSHYYRFDSGFDVFEDFYASKLEGRRKREQRRSMRAVRRVAGDTVTARLKRGKTRFNCLRECAREGNPALHAASRGEKVTERALELIGEARGKGPFFLWLHYMDVHGYFYSTQADRRAAFGATTPLDDAVIRWRRYQYVERWTAQVLRSQEEPPGRGVEHSERDKTYLTGFYDASVMYADRALRPLFDWMRADGNTLGIVTADHGEQFYDHGKIGHAPISIYEEVARVPLIVYGPGVERGEVGEWISHSAVPAGIASAAGLGGDTFGDASGLLEGTPPAGPVFTEALYGVRAPFPRKRFDEHGLLVAAREGSHKYIWREEDGAEQLFDLSCDPGETESLIGREEAAGAEEHLRAAVRQRAREIGVADARAKLTDRVRRLGRSMGLVEEAG